MRDPYWHDATASLYSADAREVLTEMPAGSIDCVVTTPPPWTPDATPAQGRQAPGNYGHEPTPALYVAALRRVMAAAHRILTDEGTCWLVTSDRHADTPGSASPPRGRHRRRIRDQAMTGLPIGSLIGLPWQIAFALQDDGWIIRNAIVWDQPTLDKAATADRFSLSHELIFLLVKSDQYYFDRDAIRRPLDRLIIELGLHDIPDTEQGSGASVRRCSWSHIRQSGQHGRGTSGRTIGHCRDRRGTAKEPSQRHDPGALPVGPAGDVWSLPVRPQRHTLPIEVPLSCIAAGCRPSGTVLDMFAANGTTGIAARQLGRSFIGVEQSPALRRIAARNLREDSGHADGDTR